MQFGSFRQSKSRGGPTRLERRTDLFYVGKRHYISVRESCESILEQVVKYGHRVNLTIHFASPCNMR